MASRARVRRKSVEELAAFAVGHRIRIEAMTIFNERVASTTDVSKAIGENLNTVGHHVKELREAGCIEFVRSEPRGGSFERYFRATRRPELSDEEWLALPGKERVQLVATVFRNLMAEGLASIRASKMSTDDDLCLHWRAANLDAQGRKEAAEEQAESLQRLLEIEARANARMIEEGKQGAAVSTVFAVLGFTRSRNGRPTGEFPPTDKE